MSELHLFTFHIELFYWSVFDMLSFLKQMHQIGIVSYYSS